jgi:hypothetical protein
MRRVTVYVSRADELVLADFSASAKMHRGQPFRVEQHRLRSLGYSTSPTSILMMLQDLDVTFVPIGVSEAGSEPWPIKLVIYRRRT